MWLKLFSFIFLFQISVWAKPNKYVPDLVTATDPKFSQMIKRGASPDYWALSPFYIPQVPAHCGTFSMMMIVNGYAKEVKAEFETWFDKDVEKIISREQVSKGGHTLDQLQSVLKLKLGNTYDVQLVRPEKSAAGLKKFRQDLVENEKSDKDFIILNFLQNRVNDTPEDKNNEVGHVSPLGGYLKDKDMALVFDVDREYFVPYWAPAEKIYHAMVDGVDSVTGKTRGYIYVKRK